MLCCCLQVKNSTTRNLHRLASAIRFIQLLFERLVSKGKPAQGDSSAADTITLREAASSAYEEALAPIHTVIVRVGQLHCHSLPHKASRQLVCWLTGLHGQSQALHVHGAGGRMPSPGLGRCAAVLLHMHEVCVHIAATLLCMCPLGWCSEGMHAWPDAAVLQGVVRAGMMTLPSREHFMASIGKYNPAAPARSSRTTLGISMLLMHNKRC